MGKLRDIINARSKGEKVDYKLNVEELITPSPVQAETDEQVKKDPLYYNRTWLSKVVDRKSTRLNSSHS